MSGLGAYFARMATPVWTAIEGEYAEESEEVKAAIFRAAARPMHYTSDGEGAPTEHLKSYFKRHVTPALRAAKEHAPSNSTVVVAAYLQLVLKPYVFWAGKPEPDERAGRG